MSTTTKLLRLPPAPRHDPKKDGNPFAWIVATAPKVRAANATMTALHKMANKEPV